MTQMSTSTTPRSISTITFKGCSPIDDYHIFEKLGEGTFGEVHKASNKTTSQLVALKKILLHNEEEGFPITALREIRILKELHHENIIPLLDMSVERGDRASRKRSVMYMVTPYMDHDLTGLLENPYVKLSIPQIKCYLNQLLKGINHIHQLKYLHRDIKASNILINNQGIVKIADFGLARQYLGHQPTEKGGAGPGEHKYTAMVVTRWYRPPELILGEARYTTAIDMWGVGCVFAEMFRKKPILQGHSDTDQGHLIFQLLGSPDQENMPGYDKLPVAEKVTFGPYKRQFEAVYKDLSETARDLLSSLLTLNPEKRLSALGALAHPYFKTEPLAAKPQDLPKYAESHELTARKNRQKAAAANGTNNHNNNSVSHPRPPHAPNVPHAQHNIDDYEYNGRQGQSRRNDGYDNRRNDRDYDNRRYDRDHDNRRYDRDYDNRRYDRDYDNRRYDRNYSRGERRNYPSDNYRTYQPPVAPPYRKYGNPAVRPQSQGSYSDSNPHPPPGPPPLTAPYRKPQPPPPATQPPYRRGEKTDEIPPPYKQQTSSTLNYDDDVRH